MMNTPAITASKAQVRFAAAVTENAALDRIVPGLTANVDCFARGYGEKDFQPFFTNVSIDNWAYALLTGMVLAGQPDQARYVLTRLQEGLGKTAAGDIYQKPFKTLLEKARTVIGSKSAA